MQKSIFSLWQLHKSPTPTGKPSPPGSLRAEKVDRDSLTLAWTPPLDDDQSITRYIIEMRSADSNQWEPLSDVSGRTKWFMVRNLPPGGSFYFRVIAENPAGQSEPAELSVPVELKAKKGMQFFSMPFKQCEWLICIMARDISFLLLVTIVLAFRTFWLVHD